MARTINLSGGADLPNGNPTVCVHIVHTFEHYDRNSPAFYAGTAARMYSRERGRGNVIRLDVRVSLDSVKRVGEYWYTYALLPKED